MPPPQAPSVPLFNRLKWLPYYTDALISKCIIAYKRLQGDVPVYRNDLLIFNSNIHSRKTRYCNFNLTSPRYNRKTEGGRTLPSQLAKHGTAYLCLQGKGIQWTLQKKHCEMNFLNNSRILIIFLFMLIDELWHDYNTIFYLLNSLGDSIVSVFFGFFLVFFIA